MYDDSVSAAFAAARRTLEQAGAVLVEIDELPDLRRISASLSGRSCSGNLSET